MLSRQRYADTSSRSSVRTFGATTLAVAFVAVYAGCGGATAHDAAPDAGASPEGGPVTTPVEAGAPEAAPAADAGSDAQQGAPSTTYPAFKVDVGQIIDNGGPVLKAPVVVTITWSTDPDFATYEALGDAIGPSPYWSDINSEYGVGVSTSGSPNHINITTPPPASFDDQDLDAWVETSVGTTWPASTANTVYAIYLPPGAPMYLGGPADAGGEDACSLGIGGYHVETQNKNYVYAIMPHCSYFKTVDVELGASHELNEAATDPHPYTNPAWVEFDQDHLGFEFLNAFQDELGDACESFPDTSDSTDFTPYTVQRQWSNKSAAAGSQWCLPKISEPFYNTTFLPTSNLQDIIANLAPMGQGYGKTPSKGFKVALNQTVTFPIGLFSDMATSAPFTLDVQGLDANSPISQDENGNPINNGTATVTLDKASGVNGDIVNVTVTPTAYSTLGVTFFYIRAVLPGAQEHHYLPVVISQN